MNIRKLFVLFLLTYPLMLLAGKAYDPFTTTLPTYLLPDYAAADGNLSEWKYIPVIPAERFHATLKQMDYQPSADFSSSVRCGMKRGSNDLYFLVVVKDNQRFVEDQPHWILGDYLELYLDYGREARDKDFPKWNAKRDTKWLAPPSMGQFGFRPQTLQVTPNTVNTQNAKDWNSDFASVLIDGGFAYEVRVDSASVLKTLKMKTMPAYLGIDFGLMDQDYMVELSTEGWNNIDATYKLFGDGMEHSFPDRYGMVSAQPVPLPAVAHFEPLPRSLKTHFGEYPTVKYIKDAIAKLPSAELVDLIYWAGVQGTVFDVPLVKALMATGDPLVEENCLAVLNFTDQPAECRKVALDNVYLQNMQKDSPYTLAIVNLLNQQIKAGYQPQLQVLLNNDDTTVAITAAQALADVGSYDDAKLFAKTLADILADLRKRVNGPFHPEYGRLTAYRVLASAALEKLQAHTEPVIQPTATPVRKLLSANTDLERFIPADGNTVYNAKDLLRTWPKTGPKELWRAEVGHGKSAVIEVNGRAFTTVMTDGKQWALCLNPLTGKTIWKHLLVDKESHHVIDGPSVSPIADGDRVYFIPGGNWDDNGAVVACLRAIDGSEIWRENTAFWGREGTTPLIIDDLLIIGTTQQNQAVIAVNKMTGKIVWKTPPTSNEAGSGAASISYQILDGIPQIILGVGGHSNGEVWGINAKTGEIFWRYPCNTHNGLLATPTAIGSKVLICNGQGGSGFSACLQMYIKDGKIRMRQLYYDNKVQLNMYNTPAVVDNIIYGFSSGSIECSRLDDGKLLWKKESKNWGAEQQLIIADGLIYAISKPGELVMLAVDPTGYKELGRVNPGIDFGLCQQPTIANGHLYLRGEKWVVCYDLLDGK
ncbi:MAG: PQQ-binding-like beta-propeller repeat protein [bacterium]